MSVPEYLSHYDLLSFEGRKAAMTMLMGLWNDDGRKSTGDIKTFKPELLNYLPGKTITEIIGETAVVRFKVESWMLNGLLYIQGGILISMIDCVCGALAGIVSNDNIAGTLVMYTSYFRPITMKDEYVTVRARLINSNTQTMYIEAQLINADGKVAVRAVTNVMKRL